MKYIWIIGGSMHHIPAINEAKRLGLGVICSDYNAQCVAKDLVDIFINISIYDKDAHIEHIKRLQQEKIDVAGIVCIAVDAAITMGAVNDYFGFCGISEKIATMCKDKTQFRQLLEKSDIPNAQYQIFTNTTPVKINWDTIELPVIVKPNNGFGSVGAKIFHKNENIESYIEQLLNEYAKVLLEEFYVGEEQTVEAIFDCHGVFTPEFITDRFFTREVYPVEIGLQHPTSLPQSIQDELFNLARKTGEVLGIKSGTIKLDSIVTAKGVRIIEATVRVAGGFDPNFLVPAATGKNIMQNAILTALGMPLDKKALQDTKHKYALTGSPLPKPGIITKIKGLEEAQQIDGVEDIFLLTKVGEQIKEYKDGTSRICFILVSDFSLEKAKNILQQAINTIHIETEEL